VVSKPLHKTEKYKMPTSHVLADKKDTYGFKRQTFWAIAGEDVLEGDIVCFDLTQSGDERYKEVVKADTDDTAGSYAIAGVALAAVSSGAPVEVCTWGVASVLLNGTTDIAAADQIVISGTAGVGVTRTITATNGGTIQASLEIPVVGIALEAYTTDATALKSVFVRVPGPY